MASNAGACELADLTPPTIDTRDVEALRAALSRETMRWLASTSAVAGCSRLISATTGAAAVAGAAGKAAPPAGLNLSATSRTRANASSAQVLASFSKSTSRMRSAS